MVWTVGLTVEIKLRVQIFVRRSMDGAYENNNESRDHSHSGFTDFNILNAIFSEVLLIVTVFYFARGLASREALP